MPLTQDYWCIKAVIIASFARCIVVVYYIISYSICMQFCEGVHTAHLSHPFALHHHTKKISPPEGEDISIYRNRRLCTKVVEEDVLGGNAKAVEHIYY